MKMSQKRFDRLYETVKRLSKIGEVTEFNSVTTSLYDWMKDGDCESVPARKIAEEWDALNGYESLTGNKRSAQLATTARAIIEKDGVDHIRHGGKLLPMARSMMTQTGCSVDTAKRHLAKQLRLIRGEIVAGRGGVREGAGRPLKDKESDG